MPPINPNTVRVVDPILTTVAQGYQHPERVGALLFPRVPVQVRGGKILTFGKESFLKYNARRAPGAGTKRIEFGYDGDPFALAQDALEGKVPFEWMQDASVVPGIDLGSRSVKMVMNVVTNLLEIEQAGIATDATKYDANHKLALAGGTKWSSATGTPITDVSNAKEAVRQSTGMDANTMVLSPGAWKAAQNNPQVTERFKYTQDGPITLQQFATLVEIPKIAVGKAVYVNSEDDANFSDVWGNNAVLAYVPDNPEGMEQPSYGYTYTLDGNPLVETPYQDRNAKSWIYPVTYDRAPVMAGMAAGFLIQNPK